MQRVEFLGYHDSGMMGTPENDLPDAFWQADVEEAAERLAKILREEDADILTVYDSDGDYGHPDHIQVHRVGLRAAELAGTPRVFEATMNRDHLKRAMLEAAAARRPARRGRARRPAYFEHLRSARGGHHHHGRRSASSSTTKRASMRGPRQPDRRRPRSSCRCPTKPSQQGFG